MSQMVKSLENDLIWYFCHSQGDCGSCSNWNAMVVSSQFGTHEINSDYFTDQMLESICRRKRIERTFFKLNRLDQNYLFMSFGPNCIIGPISKVFQNLAGMAIQYCLDGQYDLDRLEFICKQIMDGKSIESECRQEITAIRIWSQTNLLKAKSNYIGLCGKK